MNLGLALLMAVDAAYWLTRKSSPVLQSLGKGQAVIALLICSGILFAAVLLFSAAAIVRGASPRIRLSTFLLVAMHISFVAGCSVLEIQEASRQARIVRQATFVRYELPSGNTVSKSILDDARRMEVMDEFGLFHPWRWPFSHLGVDFFLNVSELEFYDTFSCKTPWIGDLNGRVSVKINGYKICDDDVNCEEILQPLRGALALRSLELVDIPFSKGSLSSIESLSNLETLTVSALFTDATDSDANLPALACLKHLYIHGDFDADKLLSKLAEFRSLETLNIDGARNTNSITERLRSPKLSRLFVMYTDFGDAGARSLARNRMQFPLTAISFEFTPFGDDGIVALAESGCLEKLEVLSIQGTSVSERGLECIQACNSLRVLELNNARPCDGLARLLQTLRHLESLELGCGATDELLDYLVRLQSLRELTVIDASLLSDRGLEALQDCSNLERIHFSNASALITDQGVRKFLESRPRCHISVNGDCHGGT